MPVPYEELAGSPTWEYRQGRVRARRRFRVAWDDAFEFVGELWGNYRLVGGKVAFTPPAFFPGMPQAIVTEVQVEPFDPRSPSPAALGALSSSTNHYASGARVTAEYTTLDDRDRADLPEAPAGTILRFSCDLGCEFQSIPARIWTWDVPGAPELDPDVDPGLLLPVEDLRLSWERVPLPPWNAIRDLRGRVNGSTFLGHVAETVLFVGARASRDFQIVDSGLWRIVYHFKVREATSTADPNIKHGWNHLFRRTGVGSPPEHWAAIQDEDGNRMYATGDFAELFVFG